MAVGRYCVGGIRGEVPQLTLPTITRQPRATAKAALARHSIIPLNGNAAAAPGCLLWQAKMSAVHVFADAEKVSRQSSRATSNRGG